MQGTTRSLNEERSGSDERVRRDARGVGLGCTDGSVMVDCPGGGRIDGGNGKGFRSGPGGGTTGGGACSCPGICASTGLQPSPSSTTSVAMRSMTCLDPARPDNA